MQGMRFLVLDENGPINHGIIVSKVTDDKYLCTFTRVPVVSRLCGADEIMGWNLFPTDDAMNKFIVEIQKQSATPPPLADPPGTRSGQSPTKEQLAAKKKAKKKLPRGKKVARKKK